MENDASGRRLPAAAHHDFSSQPLAAHAPTGAHGCYPHCWRYGRSEGVRTG